MHLMCGVREKRRRVGTCSGSINSSTWKCKRWLVEDETVVQRKSRLLNYKMTMNRGDGPGRGRVVICVAGGNVIAWEVMELQKTAPLNRPKGKACGG